MSSSILSQKLDRHMKANTEILNLMEKELKSRRGSGTPLGQSSAKMKSSQPPATMMKKLSTTALKNKPEAVTVVSNLSKNHKVSSQINSAVTKCDKRVKVRKFLFSSNSNG